MSKGLERSQATVFTGIDVSAARLATAVQQAGRDGFRRKEFANSASGHKQLIAWLLQCGGRVRVSLEATGTYSLDVALALDAAEGIEVAVLNPKTVHRFAQTLRRSKPTGPTRRRLPSTAAGWSSCRGSGPTAVGWSCARC